MATSDLHPNRDAEYARLRQRSNILTTVCVIAGLVAFTGNFVPDEWTGLPLVGLVLLFTLWWPAYRLRSRLKLGTRQRDAQPLPAEHLATLDRPPVVYLRSFDDDQRAARIKGALTEEEHLGKVLSQLGPFVAVGRPGEPLPAMGASRVYLGDDEWQTAVEKLVQQARLVVIRTGGTKGLEWEVERAARLLTPERLLLLVDNRRELRELLAQIRRLRPAEHKRVWMGWRSIGSVRGFVAFDQQWRPVGLRARGPGLYFFRTDKGGIGHTAKRFARTLDPVFQTLGERWQGPPLNGGLIILSGLTVAIFLAAIILDLLGY
jgi:hypothetical protein